MLLIGTINAKSGTFTLNADTHSDSRYKIVVTGPSSAEFIDRNIPTPGFPAIITDEVFDTLVRAASEFCYSWSADTINTTRNELEIARNNLELDRNEIITKMTNTAYDLRDDIRAITHRATNVDEGIYTQKACWETGCVENKSLRVATLNRAWVNNNPIHAGQEGYVRMVDDYIANKSPDFRTHVHNEDVPDDLPQVPPRTSGSVDPSGGNV